MALLRGSRPPFGTLLSLFRNSRAPFERFCLLYRALLALSNPSRPHDPLFLLQPLLAESVRPDVPSPEPFCHHGSVLWCVLAGCGSCNFFFKRRHFVLCSVLRLFSSQRLGERELLKTDSLLFCLIPSSRFSTISN